MVLMKKLRLILTPLICIALAWSNAVGANDLYATEVEVLDESPEARGKGLSAALVIVIQQVSGDQRIGQQPDITEALADASSLVQQFRYHFARSESVSDHQQPEETRYLWVKFDQNAVDGLLQKVNARLRAKKRRRALLWLAVERHGQRYLLDLHEAPASYAKMVKSANSQDIQLKLPLLDLQDQTQLRIADLWMGYEPAIRAASQRYPHDVILVGRLREKPNQHWFATWSLFGQTAKYDFTLATTTLPQALAQGFQQAREPLVEALAAASNTVDQTLRVRFSGIETLGAYGRLMALIKQLEPSHQFRLRRVIDDSLLFDVAAMDGQTHLVNQLKVVRQLMEVPVDPSQDESADLVYRFVM
jgi:hypothetical protein